MSVGVEMIDARVEREAVLALDDPEPEAIPIRGAGVDTTCLRSFSTDISPCLVGLNSISRGLAMVCRTMCSASVVFEPIAVGLVPGEGVR